MSKFMPHSVAVVFFFSVFSFNLSAKESYQVELSAEYLGDKESVDEIKAIALSAEVYFDKVKSGSHPYAENAYLEQASRLGIAYVDLEYTGASLSMDESDFFLLARYIDPLSHLILEGGAIEISSDINNGVGGGVDGSGFVFGLGTYVNSHSSVVFNYLQVDLDIDIAPGFVAVSKEKITDIGVAYKSVTSLEGGKAFNFEASITSSEFDDGTASISNTIVELVGDYYLDKTTSIGALLEMNSGDDEGNEGQTMGLRFKKFVTPVISVAAEVSQFNADNFLGEDSDRFLVGVAARF